jgi:hypothetical protein
MGEHQSGNGPNGSDGGDIGVVALGTRVWCG